MWEKIKQILAVSDGKLVVVSEEDASVYVVMRHEDFIGTRPHVLRQQAGHYCRVQVFDGERGGLREANERFSLSGVPAEMETAATGDAWRDAPQLKDLPL